MAFTLLSSEMKGSTNSGVSVTTDAIDTTGASLIVMSVHLFGDTHTTDPTDSEGNVWVRAEDVPLAAHTRIYYCIGPTTSGSHTFSYSQASPLTYPTINVAAFSSAGPAVFDQDLAEDSPGSTTNVAAGPITPSGDDALVLAAATYGTITESQSVSGGALAIVEQTTFDNGQHMGGALAYEIQTTATAITATFSTVSGSAGRTATIISFAEGVSPKIGCFILGGTESGASNVDTTHTGYIALDDVARTVSGEGVVFVGGSVGMLEQASPPAAIAGTALIFAEDNGSGKLRLMCQFPTGSAQQLAIEP